MRAALAAGAAVPLGLAAAPRVFAAVGAPAAGRLPADWNPPICHTAAEIPPVVIQGAPRALRLTWNANAICTVGVPVAQAKGIFAKHNLQVELQNFGGSTDQLLEAIATGKADAGVGMALRWLKPMEQGFDVRITTAIHGGCMRLFAKKGAGITGIADLKGKTVGVTDLGAPDKNFFSIVLTHHDIDPLSDVDWKVYPADMLGVALQRGEIQVISLGDPLGWIIRERDDLQEIANNLDSEYAHRACCVLGVRGSLIRDDRAAAAALTQSIIEAQEFVANNPDEAAAIFAPYSPAKPAQLAAMLRSHTHHHHPTGAALQDEIALYINELKDIQVIKPSTNATRLSAKVYADVLS
jgi:NitT/TauT family transport system substrate-binding protein